MPATRKISVRKIIQTLVTLIAVTGVAMAMISADRQHRVRLVRDVRLKIKNPSGVEFVTDEAVRNLLFASRHVDPLRQSLESLDERSMEAILRSNPWVEDAQVFTDAERVMHIILTQRVPVVRIFEEDGNSYYLDAALQAMPLSSQYTHYTPVVTGVPHLLNDSAANVVKGNIVGLISFLGKNAFWSAQVSQVDMRSDGDFELIPILGNQKIILGDTSRIAEKLGNLLAFYKQIQNRIGWDKYTSIDLRFKGEVIAAPALQWKRPADAALSNMSWLKAIMDHAPANQEQWGGDATAHSDSLTGENAPKLLPGTAGGANANSRLSSQPNAKPVVPTGIIPALRSKPSTVNPPASAQAVPPRRTTGPNPGNEKKIKPHATTTR